MSSSPYYVQAQSDGTFAVMHEHHGLVEDNFGYRSTAFDFITECEANDAEMAQHALNEQRAAALADFLHAVSRGDFDHGIHVGVGEDRVESAYITALRQVA